MPKEVIRVVVCVDIVPKLENYPNGIETVTEAAEFEAGLMSVSDVHIQDHLEGYGDQDSLKTEVCAVLIHDDGSEEILATFCADPELK